MFCGPINVDRVTEGMPQHPAFEDRKLMWLTEGDEWWFRKITTPLIPKAVPNYVRTLPEVRYVVCAIRHHEENFDDGFDFTMWMQVETKDRQGNTIEINSVMCLPPSYVVGEDRLDKAVQAIDDAFSQTYMSHKWITQYPSGSVTELLPDAPEEIFLSELEGQKDVTELESV